MTVVLTVVEVPMWVLAVLTLALTVQLAVRIPTGAWQAHVPKVGAQSISAYLVVIGLFVGVTATMLHLRGATAGMPVVALLGLLGALLAADYVRHATSPHDAFEDAFGPSWTQRLPAEAAERMLQRRWHWWLPGGDDPRWDRDVPYAAPPGTGRELLADIWQPPTGLEPSGLGLVYVHGGYYEMLDKDSGTRPLFRHLARQGHVIMDISYRLVDEADIFEMVGDVKRAVSWLKHHATTYGIDPDRIVLAGASSGGNLALLAAYTPHHPDLTPADVEGDTSVRGVVSYYGVHEWPAFFALDDAKDTELIHQLLGGTLDDVPDRFDLASPVSHVRPDTPITLLVQGQHDVQHLVDANRRLGRTLAEAGVPVVTVELPRTDHAFDLIVARLSPPGMAALHDLERFLALLTHDADRSSDAARRPARTGGPP